MFLTCTLLLSAPLLPAAPQHGGGAWALEHDLAGLGYVDGLGRSLAPVGDVDRDGRDDLAVGAPGATGSTGEVWIVSGATGQVLRVLPGTATGDAFGVSLAAAGDRDGDGVDELLVGAPGHDPAGRQEAGAVWLVSPATGSFLQVYEGLSAGDRLGVSVAAAGDLDGDGWPEVLAGAWWASPGGQAEAGMAVLFRGADAAVLHTFPGPAAGAHLGAAVAAGPDLDGDGWPEALLGAPDAPTATLAEAGLVEVRSLATGAFLGSLAGAGVNTDFGFALAFAGDVDGDGREDFLVGAPLDDPGGVANAGAVRLYSGAGLALLQEFAGESFMDQLGYAVAGPGDLNGDGIPDLAAGARFATPDPASLAAAGTAFLWSGASGREMARFPGLEAQDHQGTAVAAAGDVDGDGWPDLAVGAPGNPTGIPPGNADGALRLYRFDPIVQPSGAAISASAGGRVDLVVDFPDDAGGDLYLLLASAAGPAPPVLVAGLEVPLADDPVLRATLAGLAPPLVLYPQGQVLAADGTGLVRIQAPPGALAGWQGTVFHMTVVCAPAGTGPLRWSSAPVPVKVAP